MSELEVTLAPPNSIVFIADPTQDYVVPDDAGSALVTSTASCIGIGTLAEMDGETTIKLGEAFLAPEGTIVFDNSLETPGKRVAVISSSANEILSMPVSHRCSHVRVWVNDPTEPNQIFIEIR